MSEPLERRTVWLLVPDRDRTSVLVDGSGELPSLTFGLYPGDTTVGAAGGAARALGLQGAVIDCFIDQTPFPEGAAAVVPAVVELAGPIDGSPPPGGLRWAPIDAVSTDVGPGLSGYVADRLEEWRGALPVPPTRSPWCLPGWYERAVAWIDQVLGEAGMGPVVSVTQVRHWGISAVMRVDTAGGRYWFKSVIGVFFREPMVTDFLHRLHPGLTPPVVAVEPHEGWLLMAELPGTTVAVNPDATEQAIRTLVALQHEFIGRTDELLAGGFVHRPLAELPAAVESAMAMPCAAAELELADGRREQLLTGIERAIGAVGGLGIPSTLAHGDFHPGNVMALDDRVVLFDWSDAAVTHPLVDVAVWASWFRDEPDTVDRLWRAFAQEWADLADPAAIVAARPHFDVITGAYHLVSYAHLVEALEPRRRPENLGGLTGFFSLLDRSVRA